MINRYENYPLLAHNTFGMEVSAARFIEYDTTADLQTLLTSGELAEPWLHIGGGSNLLFLSNYPGILLHSLIRFVEVIHEDEAQVCVRVGAGMGWDDFVAYCVERNWYGAENLSLIPGEVGAAAVQNIGAYGVEVKDLIQSVEVMDASGKELLYPVAECRYAYRHSLFKEPRMNHLIVTSVTFVLSKIPAYNLSYGSIQEELNKRGEALSLSGVRNTIIDIRCSKLPDPAVMGNAGSFFMNPVVDRAHYEKLKEAYPDMPHYEVDEQRVKIPAGWMIDRCGWKGKSVGAAGVHDKQALVLVNKGGATGTEIAHLAAEIQESVAARFGIRITPEVKFV